ncbi:MAG: ThuA domain-containing protein [Balneolaceae bacterium]
MSRNHIVQIVANTLMLTVLILTAPLLQAQEGVEWITFEPGEGPGNGKHIVLVSGDEEYRSEEAMPLLAKILSEHHGFRTTVLFAIDPETGEINPDLQTNIPGLEQLGSADLAILFLRFRELPDEQMRHIDRYIQAGKPIVALRTSTHAFNYTRNPDSPYAKYSWGSDYPGWEGGFGRRILGETWVDHHGVHMGEGTRALVNGLFERIDHPVIRGVRDIWAPTDVYGTYPLEGENDILLWGQSTNGMTADAPVNWSKSVMPVAWTREYPASNSRTGRAFVTTMGSATDFESEDLRRLMVNAVYWGLGMGGLVDSESNVDIVGEYDPAMFGFGDFVEGKTPSDYR